MESNTIVTPGTGAIPSPKDPRDWTLDSVGAATVYPDFCHLDTSFMRVSYQGKIGCCVGCTGEEVVRRMVYYMTGSNDELSFRFVYAVAKCLDGYAGEGTYPALVAKIIRTYGVPLAKYCQNDVTLSHEEFVYNRDLAKIPAAAFADALIRKSGADFDVPVSEEGIMRAINFAKENNGGVMILRRIGKTYWTDKQGNSTWDKNKLLPIVPTSEIVSGHEEFLTGYEREAGTGRIKIHWLNHWSENWADGGYAWEYLDEWLPYIVEIRVVTRPPEAQPGFKYRFTKTLKRGDKGPDVVALQHVLQLENCYQAGVGFTGNYGDITFNSVMRLQQKYAQEILKPAGLTHGTGQVGPRTLSWLVTHYGN